MAMAELLSVLRRIIADRPKVLDIFQRGVQAPRRSRARRVVASASRQDRQLPRDVGLRDVHLRDCPRRESRLAGARVCAGGPDGWKAVAQRVRLDGQIEGICVGTTAAYDAVYYYNRPTELDAMQGYGPTIMAGAES